MAVGDDIRRSLPSWSASARPLPRVRMRRSQPAVVMATTSCRQRVQPTWQATCVHFPGYNRAFKLNRWLRNIFKDLTKYSQIISFVTDWFWTLLIVRMKQFSPYIYFSLIRFMFAHGICTRTYYGEAALGQTPASRSSLYNRCKEFRGYIRSPNA